MLAIRAFTPASGRPLEPRPDTASSPQCMATKACAGATASLAGVNALMASTYCPTSKQPELKHAPVKLLKAELPWEMLAAAWLPEDQALQALLALRALMPRFDYAHCVPFGREPHPRGMAGVLMRAAAPEAPDDALLLEIEALLGLAGREVLRLSLIHI